MILFISLAATTLCAAAATRVVINWTLRRNLLDQPNHRSSHTRPTPRGGGVAIVLTFYAGALAIWAYGWLETPALYALLCGILVAIVGYWDDLRSLGVGFRLSAQCASAAAALAFLWPLPDLVLGAFVVPVWASVLLYGLGLIWLTNLFNFMDGIDAMAAGQTAAIGLLWAVFLPEPEALLALVFAGAALGFLFYNWPPARIFMGDVGSCFCGFTAGVLVLLFSDQTETQPAAWLIPLAILGCDATVTLFVRLWHGHRPGTAHRSHVYQRLSRAAGGHLPVSLGYMAVTVAVAGPVLAWAVLLPEQSWFALVAYATALTVMAVILGRGRDD